MKTAAVHDVYFTRPQISLRAKIIDSVSGEETNFVSVINLIVRHYAGNELKNIKTGQATFFAEI
jgi:hypothetical protein